ncbi:ATP-binding protein [Erythrobacter sp. HL-111]|uniref:sensor histidine kinase n=1 Tax=Erythrobacter sp. HL-111 TaxID=1798193 RepID=UPI0006DB87C0|nr:ATP-binding protein [Erythrobacter sp. HL-111]KPP85446.1 MAG: two-component system, NtrC family, nitrogen regulation sensor histidine kinase NtrY [Erythrobacteraceae bacterium HL-111]SDR97007.1 two-component system, NtrC family, nitrogen regulation sensor histidine kinase NtrY [Erythrobacter sp. HL-111]
MEASEATPVPEGGVPDASGEGAPSAPGGAGAQSAGRAETRAGSAERAALRLNRRSPRWLRRFIVASRRANVFLWLELLSLAGLVLAVAATWYAFSRDPEAGALVPTLQVSLLLMATLVPAMTILVLAGRRLALRRAAGSTARLHVRLVFFFSMVSAIPTLLVAGFAAFLFQTGVDFWFSDDSLGLMENANELAQNYYDANQRDVRDETLAMAGDMRFYFSRGGTLANDEFPDFYALQAQGRKINESAIIQRLGDGALRTAAIMDLMEDNRPLEFSTGALSRLEDGELVVVEGSPERIAAIAPVDRDSGIYLYNARNTEATMFNSWSRAQAIARAYDTLTGDARTLQLRFNIALVLVSLLLVGIAIWFALRFADRQVEPLTDLVGAARKVGQGNFALRVEGRTGADEIGLLNRAFNRMTAQLEKQTQALVSANRQIDDRRAFMEAVLESVTAGVVSVDPAGRVLLLNGSAAALLAREGAHDPASMVGMRLEDLSPELHRIAREGQESAIVTHPRGSDLLTLAVKVAPGTSGSVITFEDITRQLLDQRQAAWSDVARRIAHEIKNPLTPIHLATERLKRRYRKQIEEADGELFDELTSTIVRQVGALRKMVDEFSSFARLPKPVFRSEDPVDLVRQAVFLQEVAHSGIDFSVSTERLGSREMLCDRHQLGQAMTNVLKNAVEAVEARAAEARGHYEGRIAVMMEGDDQMITIMVEDNGIGLPTDRDRITEPYMTTREKGTGLGLAIVNKIVDEHGGDMSFASGEAGGTRVTLRFARNPQVLGGES